ncbi:hypothetical protein HZS_1007 [Henneguya salminicola]|nr:hypothetical protein HZS_1007 [Henneguya salminicola]
MVCQLGLDNFQEDTTAKTFSFSIYFKIIIKNPMILEKYTEDRIELFIKNLVNFVNSNSTTGLKMENFFKHSSVKHIFFFLKSVLHIIVIDSSNKC